MTQISPLARNSSGQLFDFDAVAFATQRFALISSSGGGKSYGAGRIVEDLSDAQVPVIVVDTVGIWAAIRLAADGKSPGLRFTIIGGEHADVPFEPTRAAELARFVVASNASFVIDVSDMLPEDRAEPLALFFETLLIEMKAQRRPRFVVLDEAQDVAPQHPGKGEMRLLRAVSAFVRKSRNHLCGTALLTQRPQDVSKSVLNQVGNLFVGMLFGEHERKAIARWVSSKTSNAVAFEQLKLLAELEPGDFYLWSPSWAKLFGRFRFAPKRTFDGSSTTPLDATVELGKLAPVDVAALRELLAPPKPEPKGKARAGSNGASPEHAELVAENERLRAELVELRAELTRTLTGLEERLSAGARALIEQANALTEAGGYAEAGRAVLGTPLVSPRSLPPAPLDAADPVRKPRSKDGHVSSTGASPRENARANGSATSSAADEPPRALRAGDELGEYEESLLAALKAYGPLTRKQLAVVACVSPISSTFSTCMGRLLRDGWILKGHDGRYNVNPAAVVGAPALKRGADVRKAWREQRLDDYSRKLFDALFAVRSGMTRAELAQAAGVSGISSTFSTTIGKLGRAGLFETGGGRVSLSTAARWAMS